MVMLVISAGREANDKMGRDYRILGRGFWVRWLSRLVSLQEAVSSVSIVTEFLQHRALTY
jgi:hypothetical protein